MYLSFNALVGMVVAVAELTNEANKTYFINMHYKQLCLDMAEISFKRIFNHPIFHSDLIYHTHLVIYMYYKPRSKLIIQIL